MAFYQSDAPKSMIVTYSHIRSFFICLVVITTSLQLMLGAIPLSLGQQIIILAILIMLLGMPHGALDHKVAQKAGLYNSNMGFIGFFAIYLGLAAGAFGLWLVAPALSLIAFLLISAWHFGSDFKSVAPYPSLYPVVAGTALLSAPALLHQETIAMVFGYLCPPEHADIIAATMHVIAFAVVPLSLVVGLIRTGSVHTFIEFIFVLIAGIVLPPLVFLTLFFCFSHSPKHLLELYQDLGYKNAGDFIKDLAPLTLLSILFLAGVYMIFKDMLVYETLFKSAIILLAVVTIPHMLLIDFQSKPFRHDR